MPYGSPTTSIAALLSFENAATLLSLGAQVVAEFERIGAQDQNATPRPLLTYRGSEGAASAR